MVFITLCKQNINAWPSPSSKAKAKKKDKSKKYITLWESIYTAIVLLRYDLASKNYFIELIRIALLSLCSTLEFL